MLFDTFLKKDKNARNGYTNIAQWPCLEFQDNLSLEQSLVRQIKCLYQLCTLQSFIGKLFRFLVEKLTLKV